MRARISIKTKGYNALNDYGVSVGASLMLNNTIIARRAGLAAKWQHPAASAAIEGCMRRVWGAASPWKMKILRLPHTGNTAFLDGDTGRGNVRSSYKFGLTGRLDIACLA